MSEVIGNEEITLQHEGATSYTASIVQEQHQGILAKGTAPDLDPINFKIQSILEQNAYCFSFIFECSKAQFTRGIKKFIMLHYCHVA